MEFAALLNPQTPGLQNQISLDDQLWQMTYSMIFLTVSGVILNWIYKIADYTYQQVRKKLVCSITLSSKDELFKILRAYLTTQGYLKGSMTDLKVVPKKKKNAHWWDYVEFEKQKIERQEVEFLPGPGNHIFKYKGKSLWISINEQQTLTTGWENKPTKYETLGICTYGTDTRILKEIIQEALDFNQEKDTSLVKIYQVHRWGGDWQLVQQKKPRALESVILDTNIAADLVADVQKFLESGKKYKDKDVPYRRGYLLYGPPGTGKTSFVQVIAGQLKMDICYLNLSGGNLDDDALISLLSAAPDRSIILLEDIDAIFVERTSMQDQKKSTLTFSGLLNALDGVRSQEGRIMIMTTNHKEKLDPALLRPGRADVHYQLNLASENQMKNLLLKFFPDTNEDQIQQFVQQLPEFRISMAKLQGHFLKYRDSLEDAISNAKLLLEIDQQIKEMTIDEWLRRLNLPQYAPQIKKTLNIKYVKELCYLTEADLIEYGMSAVTERRRIMEMIQDVQDVKQQFQMQNNTQLRQIIQLYTRNQTDLEEIVELCGEEQITGFQLRDILESNKDLDLAKQKIYHKVQHNQAIVRGQAKLEIEDQEDDKQSNKDQKSKDDFLADNVEEFLKTIGLEAAIPKLQEHEISDPEIFFGLTEDEMINYFEIKTEGKKYKFKKQMKQLKEDNEKKKAEKEEEKIRRRTGETFELLQKRSTLIF